MEELAEGGSLHERLHGTPGARRRRPLPYGALLRVAADVAEAMCYLHPRIVHRDLKAQVGAARGGHATAAQARMLASLSGWACTIHAHNTPHSRTSA